MTEDLLDIASLLIVVCALWAVLADPQIHKLVTPKRQYRGGNQAVPRMAHREDLV